MTNKPVKLPEAGQWPDKVAPWALLAGIVLSTLGFLMAFLYAGPVNGAAVDGMEHLVGIDVERERDGLPAVVARGILRTR